MLTASSPGVACGAGEFMSCERLPEPAPRPPVPGSAQRGIMSHSRVSAGILGLPTEKGAFLFGCEAGSSSARQRMRHNACCARDGKHEA